MDLRNQRFGRLVAVEPAQKDKSGNCRWLCRCDCGASTISQEGKLRSGHARSCGCLQREASTKHGLIGTRVYEIWRSMSKRCLNPRHKSFPSYGGRGIKVCARWSDVAKFYADMGDPPAGMSLDRIDNNGDYEPGNCRWATPAQQTRNRRPNVNLTLNGRTMCVTDWARETGVSRETIYTRLRRGWSIERALSSARSYKEASHHV